MTEERFHVRSVMLNICVVMLTVFFDHQCYVFIEVSAVPYQV